MNKEEMLANIESLSVEVRSIADELLDTSKDVNEVRGRLDAKKEELRKAKLAFAQLEMPKEEPVKEVRSALFDKDAWLNAAKEHRSLTVGSNGAVAQIKQLFTAVGIDNSVLNQAKFYYGPNAMTSIPVLAPTIADPSSAAEGATNVSADTTAVYGTCEIQPLAYMSVLPISAEALSLGTIDLEAELPAVFAKAFRNTMHNGMMQGAGTNKTMKGLFTSATAGNSTAANFTMSALANLATTVAGKDEPYSIVMNPSIYAKFIADTTSGEDVKIYKECLIRDKMIEGVPVILDSKAPSAITSGSILAVAAPLARYAIGVAGEVQIDPIKVPGDANTYFQATMFFSGKQISDSDVYSIKKSS